RGAAGPTIARTDATADHDHRSPPEGKPPEMLRHAAEGTARYSVPDVPGGPDAAAGGLRSACRRRARAVGKGPGVRHPAARRQLAVGRRDDGRLRRRAASLVARLANRLSARLEA